MFVISVKHEKYNNSLKIVSDTSYTTSCLAFLAMVNHDNFSIVEGLMTTVHAISAEDHDAPSVKWWCYGQEAAQSIIPASTGITKVVDLTVRSGESLQIRRH